MGGLVLDILIGYVVTFFRILVRNRRARRCRGWREVEATVVGVSWQAEAVFPRPDAKIVYTYHVDGGFYGGVDTKPFYFKTDAKEYASRFAKGDGLPIRIKPQEPETSVVLDGDLEKTGKSASAAPEDVGAV
jgi:hypothetical protein